MGMRTFCGIIMRQQVRADEALLDTMVETFNGGGKPEKIVVNRFALTARNDSAGGKNDSERPAYSDEAVSGTFNGRLDIEDITAIEAENIPLAAQSNKYIFKSLYKYILRYILKYIYEKSLVLQGDFAAAIYDKNEDRLLLVRDPLGTRPLYYLEHANYFAFATEMKALKALPGFVPEMDETWIADAISTVQSEQWRTPYKQIKRVLPGHVLVFNHFPRQERYWNLKVDKDAGGLDYSEAVEAFREKLFKAIENRIRGDQFIASELSGGLDSSGVTSIAYQLAQQSGQSMFALTHAFSETSLGQYFPYTDERDFSREVCRFIGLENQIMCDVDGYGLLDMLKRNVFIQSGPTQQGYSMFSDTLYERAQRRGVTKILSGFGGDEGVTSKAGGFFDELAAHGRWPLFKKEYFLSGEQPGAHHGTQSGTTLDAIYVTSRLQKKAAYILWRYFPFAKKYIRDLMGRSDWRTEKYPGLGFTSEFEKRMGIEKRFYERVNFPDDPDVRNRQYKRIMHDHVSQRFEYSYIDAKAYGMEYAYPLWDIDLLEFYYSLPAEYKFRYGMGRSIYRDAMKGLLPEKIRLRNDKTGATVPTVQQRFLKDYDAITDLIQRSRSGNKYHYLDYDKMLAWQKRMKNRGFNDKIPANPAAFFNSLQILLL